MSWAAYVPQSKELLEGPQQRKFIDWKKTKLFRFRWNWAEEKKLRGFRLQISSLSYIGGGGDFVDTATFIAVKMRQKGMKDIWFCENSMLKNKLLYHSFQKSMHFAF